MPIEKPSTALLENIITILAHDDVNGKLVVGLVEADLFEGDYRVIAERCINYWRKYKQAPKEHTADLFSDIIDDKHNRRGPIIKRLIASMVQLADSMNVDFVLDQLRVFTRMQKIKDAILKSADRLNSKQEVAIGEVETIWNDILHQRDEMFTPGLHLTDYEHLLNHLRYQQTEFVTGIAELDKRGIVPKRQATMLLLAGKGKGKSWFLINIGKQSLLQRKKVLHITLEMSEESVLQRYYQALFSVSKREASIETTRLKLDKFGKLSELMVGKIKPDFTFESEAIAEELEQRVLWFAQKFTNVIIKRINSLTVEKLAAYLDNLEIVEKFVPDIILLDYIGLMKIDIRNPRMSIGRNYIDFRELCSERNMAGVTAHQSSKKGILSQTVRSTHSAEDFSLIQTSDTVLTFSATDMESKYGLGRLFVDHARDEEDKFGVLLTQSYKVGQFVLESTPLNPSYFDVLNDLSTDEQNKEQEDDDD